MSASSTEKLWKLVRDPSLRTLAHSLGIEITELRKDLVKATMPVDERTVQIHGILHGGASVALAETLASIGASAQVDLEKEYVVGLEINANHIRAVKSGKVVGESRPLHVGRRTQVWQTEVKDEAGKLVSVSRCTLAVMAREQ